GASTLSFIKPAAAPGAPDLTLTKAALTSVSPSQTMTYTLTDRNIATGSNNATGVQLIDTLPANVSYVSSSCTGGCTFDSLTNTTGYTSTNPLIGSGSLSTATKISNDQIKVVLGGTGTFNANNKFLATSSLADLQVSKDDGVASVNAGGSTVYTVRVNNNGPS